MRTTALFVELLVIGVGAYAWVGLVVALIFGLSTGALWQVAGSLPWAVPALGVIYLLGILTDRLADKVFALFWADRERRKEFESAEDYYRARDSVTAASERFSELFEYSRSRQRICRGWALNSLLLWIAALALLLARSPLSGDGLTRVLVGGTTLAWILSIACWSTWRSMYRTELVRLKAQSELVGSRTADVDA